MATRRSPTKKNRTEQGKQGEQIACDFLTGQGYAIVERNYRQKRGEVDIIGVQDERIVFVEVKAWSSYPIAALGQSINREKQRRIVSASRLFLASHPEYATLQPQYDVVFVQSGRVTHLENAFAGNGAW